MKSAAKSVPNHLLRKAREKRGWSQRYVAEYIGAHRYYISRWERGMISPSPHYRQQLCTLFGKDAEELGMLSTGDSENTTTPLLPTHSPFYWNIPYRRNPFFTGRTTFLIALHERLQTHSPENVRLPLALAGLGGMGKTQIIVEYAYRFRSSYQAILWLRADSPETLLTDCQTILNQLDIPSADIQDHRLLLTLLQRWLDTSREWLLILDNVDDTTLLVDLLPIQWNGSVVVTTRAQTLGAFTETIAVNTLPLEEGMLLLLRRARLLPLNQPLSTAPTPLLRETETIITLLGGLPLALDQAGAYIEETGCSISTYRERYQQRGAELLRRRGSCPPDYPLSVMTTLSLSLEKLARINPIALDVLHLCSFLSNAAIPEEVITSDVTHLETLATNPIVWDDTICALRRFSLLDRDAENKTLTMHLLVQIVVKENMDEPMRRFWAEQAVQAINKLLPDSDIGAQKTWMQWQRYSDHACTCATLIDQWPITGTDAIHLLYQTAVYLLECAHYPDARRLYRQALALCEQKLGTKHTQTGEILNDLGLLCYYTGHYHEARSFYQQALPICEQALGKEHLMVAHIRHNLGLLYSEQGELDLANILLQETLCIRERLLGLAAPPVAESLHTLALVSLKKHRLQEAEAQVLRALRIRQQALGNEHVSVAASLTLLGKVFNAQGDTIRAEQMFMQALSTYQKLHRMDERLAATCLQASGELYYSQGKDSQARDCLQRAFTIREKLLPPEHYQRQETLASLKKLDESAISSAP